MANLTVTAAKVHVVEVIEQDTLPASVALTAGQVVKVDANGKWALALATTAANAGLTRRAMVTKSVDAGMPVTAIYRGVVDPGGAIDALAYDASVFLSDTAGTLADAAGTVSTVVGTVIPGWGSGATPDKLLRLNG
jgi:hypothetical protein